RLPVRDAEIEDDRVAPTAYRRHRSQLELRVVAPEILFRREVHGVPAAAVNLSQLAQVEPRRGRQDYADVAPGRLDDERLRDVVGRDAERPRLRKRALGVRMGEELLAHSDLVASARQVYPTHHAEPPSHRI